MISAAVAGVVAMYMNWGSVMIYQPEMRNLPQGEHVEIVENRYFKDINTSYALLKRTSTYNGQTSVLFIQARPITGVATKQDFENQIEMQSGITIIK